MMNVKGKIMLKAKVQHSEYFWGPMSEVEGATLDLLDENLEGDCLCLDHPGRNHETIS